MNERESDRMRAMGSDFDEAKTVSGRYRTIARLGQGGMAEVYLVVSEGPGGFSKLQVLKRLRADFTHDPEVVTMFFDEARLAARINHPNVVQTYEMLRDGDDYFITMEYLDGQPLNRILSAVRAEPGPPGLLLQILADALAGLDYAHELRDYDGTPLNIVHRDISPHNIVVTYQGQTKVVDFGIAKAAGRATTTRIGAVKGKFTYMAPEQLRREAVDRRVDIFIIGLSLWEIAAGRRIWADHTDAEIVVRLQTGQVPDLEASCPRVDARLAAICRRALATDPGDRYATAAEMRGEILGYLDAVGQRLAPEQIGGYLERHFAAHRAKINALIEAQFARLVHSREVPVVSLRGPLSEIPSENTPLSERPASAPVPPVANDRTVRSGEPVLAPAAARAERRLDRRALAALAVVGVLLGTWIPMSRKLASSRGPAGLPASAPPVMVSAATPAPSAVPPERRADCPDGMVLIAGGRFLMGSDDAKFKLWQPAHKVTLDTFCLDTREVTQAAYQACVDEGACTRPGPPSFPKASGETDATHDKLTSAYRDLCNFGVPGREAHPINCVSWTQADAYCRSRAERLPTEAEWEYAARGPDERARPWGDAPADEHHVNACGLECTQWERDHGLDPSPRLFEVSDGWAGTAPVGSFPAGKTEQGVHDMAGNVWEWTQDWFETYKSDEDVNPKGAPAGNRKVIRGGGFNGGMALWFSPTFRYHQLATASTPAIGFRCAKSL